MTDLPTSIVMQAIVPILSVQEVVIMVMPMDLTAIPVQQLT
jgi:hypothetical protein